ncbi:helix-turn-helix domain-containing protein [Humitalea sp. 24SJ18S-53]|uniref:helix-turn-helix domain-containing protein n=1 Tax=Humitalea sp. 24SJ18S-53 TaxID=3422307 RepID=UPI003D67FB4D
MADGDVFGRIAAQASAAAVHSMTYATGGRPAAEQFAAWRDRCGSVVQITATAPVAQGFFASNTLWSLGDMALSQVSVPASGFARPKALTRRDSLDHWTLGFLRRGEMRTRVGDTVHTTVPGDLCHTCLGEAFDGERTDCDWLVLFIPRDGLRDWAPGLDATRNAPNRTPLAGLLRDYLGLLERRMPMMTQADVPALLDSTRAMIGACIGNARPQNEVTLAQLDRMRIERIRRIVQDNLRAPGFSPSRLCRIAGISRSHLYRLFEAEGGVARYIQSRRLLAAHAALADLAAQPTIAAIAEEFGFTDASSFSRAFRAEFGYRPSDARAAGLSGAALAARHMRQSRDETSDLAGFLRRLRR